MYLPEVKFYVEKRGSQLVAVAERGRGRGTGADTDIVDLCSSYLEVPFGKLAFYMCSSLTTASIPSGATHKKNSDGDGPFYNSPTTVTRRR